MRADVMVPSAPGKRFDGDTKVTDLLYKCYNTAVEGEDFIPILQEIKEDIMRLSAD